MINAYILQLKTLKSHRVKGTWIGYHCWQYWCQVATDYVNLESKICRRFIIYIGGHGTLALVSHAIYLAENNFILAQQWLHIHMQADSHSVHGATLYLWLYKQWLSLIWSYRTVANHRWDCYSVVLIQDFCFSWLKDSSLLIHLVCYKCQTSPSSLFPDLYR